MFMKYRNVLFSVCCMAGLVFVSGCTALVVGAGEKAYSHVRGDLLGIMPEPLEQTYPASVRAMEDLDGYDLVEEHVNTLVGSVVAYDKQARKVNVELKRTDQNQTSISIRIGTVGDKLESVHIYDCIRQSLGSQLVAQDVF